MSTEKRPLNSTVRSVRYYGQKVLGPVTNRFKNTLSTVSILILKVVERGLIGMSKSFDWLSKFMADSTMSVWLLDQKIRLKQLENSENNKEETKENDLPH